MRELVLFHVHTEAIGYGRYGVNLARELRAMGVDVFDDQPMPAHARRPHEDVPGSVAKRTNVVAWVSVPTHARGWWKGQYPVISSMWEAARLPEQFRESLHNFACVIVPSHQNVELFSRYHDNVHMVPLGVDPAIWHYEARTPPEAEFRFMIGGSGPRKGTDLAYRAFRALWPTEGSWGSGPVPYLIMKNPRRETFGGPRVEVIGGRLSPQVEVDLYAMAHCYLGPSRGEGFGLQPLQALAQGCPTILTGAHGHDSFAHLGLPLSTTLSDSAYFIYGDAGKWWEPDFDELCDHMRWVYDNYDTALVYAAAASQVVADQFTWARTAQRFVEAIGPERLEVPYSGPEEWFKPDEKLYPVVCLRDHTCEVAGITYHFTKGERTYEMADIKRILFESHLLDPVCLEGDSPTDTGLAAEQLARVPEYSARHAWCPTCGVKLGTGIRRADELEKQYDAEERALAGESVPQVPASG